MDGIPDWPFIHSVFCYYWLLINAATRKCASIISLTYLYCWCEVSNDVSWRQYQIEWLKGGMTLQYRDSIPPPPICVLLFVYFFYLSNLFKYYISNTLSLLEDRILVLRPVYVCIYTFNFDTM